MRWWLTLAKAGAIVLVALVAVLAMLALRPSKAQREPGPAVGDCWAGEALARVGCDAPHQRETVAVGEIRGALVGRGTPPPRSGLGSEFAACEPAAGRYLGADWRTLHVSLLLLAPSDEQWRKGARWYRCDALALGEELAAVAERRGSMRGDPYGSGPAGDLQLGCAVHVVAGNAWVATRRVACTAAHDMEFVGLAESAAAEFPATKAALDAAFAGQCRDRAQAYTAMPAQLLDSRRVSVAGRPTGEPATWAGGDRGARCWVLLDHQVTESLYGRGDVP